MVEHPAAQIHAIRQIIDEGAEADALHDARDADVIGDLMHVIVMAGRYGRCSFSQSIQASMPSPVLAETTSTWASGLRPWTNSRKASRSKSK